VRFTRQVAPLPVRCAVNSNRSLPPSFSAPVARRSRLLFAARAAFVIFFTCASFLRPGICPAKSEIRWEISPLAGEPYQQRKMDSASPPRLLCSHRAERLRSGQVRGCCKEGDRAGGFLAQEFATSPSTARHYRRQPRMACTWRWWYTSPPRGYAL
jgi:hypothetical protein